MKIKSFFLLLNLLFFIFSFLKAAELILGDQKVVNQSFNFPVNSHAFYIPFGRFFVGSSETKESNDFAVSAAMRLKNEFVPLAPERVILNNEEDKNNPLNGAAIKFLSMLDSKILVIKKGESKFYVVDDLSAKQIQVFASDILADSNGNPAKEVLAITSSAPQLTEDPQNRKMHRVAFAAVSNQLGLFNGNGSGIAAALFSTKKEGNKDLFQFQIINAQTGEKGNLALPIGLDTAELKIGNNLSNIGNIVDLFFDKNLNRLYVALQVTAGNQTQDGARAILVISGVRQEIEKDEKTNVEVNLGDTVSKLLVQSIAPETAFVSDNKIVGTKGAQKAVTLHKIRTMHTRTHLPYLIVVGGNGQDTKQEVYALPLVNNVADPAHGTLANVKLNPVDLFINGNPKSFYARTFLIPARQPDELFSNTDIAARVGFDGILPSNITDIQVSNDAIFVSVEDDGNSLQGGIFYSQALFDSHGKIKGWTRWQRVTGNAQKTIGFAFDQIDGNFWFMPGENQQTFNVFRTLWSKGETDFEKVISQEFDSKRGGVHGLFDFAYNKPGLTSQLTKRFSFLVFTGLDKILLVQTGKDNDTAIFSPTFINLNLDRFDSKDGSLNGFGGRSSLISISQGELTKIGPINSAEIINDGTNGWLVVGGFNGISILARADGSGWDSIQGLKKDFEGLTQDMAFKKFGNFTNVKKLVSFNNNLFVLTQTDLFRVKVESSAIALDNLEIKRLASIFDLPANQFSSFSDILVSPPIALLATSIGLFRSSSLFDIEQSDKVQWQQINLPESAGSFNGQGPVTRLFGISPTGFETDVKNGNVYLLNAYVGLHQSQVYRLDLQEFSDISVNLFPDLFIKDKPTFFVNLEDYRNYIVTDGAIIAISRSSYSEKSPLLLLLPQNLKSGQRFGSKNSVIVKLGIDEFNSIGKMIRSSASGAWLVPGDFGLRINQ